MSYKIDTLCVQSGYKPKTGESRIPPVVQSTTYVYEKTQDMADLFDLKSDGYFYTRLANPTVAAFEGKVAALEGGVAAHRLRLGHVRDHARGIHRMRRGRPTSFRPPRSTAALSTSLPSRCPNSASNAAFSTWTRPPKRSKNSSTIRRK